MKYNISSFLWFFPFIGLLLSIAFISNFLEKFWNRNYCKILFFWIFISLLIIIKKVGFYNSVNLIKNMLIYQYFPFIILIISLYVINSGFSLRIYGVNNLDRIPLANCIIFSIGCFLSNIIGTMGTSILLIKLVLDINLNRLYKTHVIIFFILLISNASGCLTPIGDPPLFLAFLMGISFQWFLLNLWPFFLTITTYLIIIFYIVDYIILKYEKRKISLINSKNEKESISMIIRGNVNLFLLILIILILISSGFIERIYSNEFKSYLLIIRDFLLIMITFVSFKLTPKDIYKENNFSFFSLKEIVILFLGIFTTSEPIFFLFKNIGNEGQFAEESSNFIINIINLLNNNGKHNLSIFFWMSGVLSSILDNAPTYLIFFHLAGGDSNALMNDWSGTLSAISCGVVFMGGLTYIGNAPNLVIRSIAESNNIKMPSFLMYFLLSFLILFPILITIQYIWFR